VWGGPNRQTDKKEVNYDKGGTRLERMGWPKTTGGVGRALPVVLRKINRDRKDGFVTHMIFGFEGNAR